MKIAIAGYGIEGEANYQYWNTPGNQLTILDASKQPSLPLPEDATFIGGETAFDDLDDYDMVVRTASLPPRRLRSAKKVWSATNEFLAHCPALVIGVTGTKGKGTTSSLIASVLKAAGKTVWLVGNIGTPSLSVLSRIQPNDIVVYELSSFQLWDVERAPDVGILLMVEPDHLDVHDSLDDYLAAKGKILNTNQLHQATGFYNPRSQLTRQIISIYRTKQPDGTLLEPYGDEAASTIFVKDGYFYEHEHKICSVDELRIPGDHNIDNACAALSAVRLFTNDDSAVIRGFNEFTGLPHRLKFVDSVDDVTYIDDSIATTPGSAIAAIHAFDQPKILILGGSFKGADFRPLAREVVTSSVKHVVLIGQEAERIEDELGQIGYDAVTNLGEETSMSIAVHTAHSLAQPHDVVILSPACASFGMFKNYADRGEQFIAAVTALKRG